MRNDRHLFSFAPGLLSATSEEEVKATALGLKEVGLFEMPYPRDVYMQFSAKEMVGPHAIEGHTIVYGPFGPDQVPAMEVVDGKGRLFGDIGKLEPFHAGALATFLIVMLATRNAEKRRTENKLARLGIGKSSKHRFASTTYISFPSDMPADDARPPKGGMVTPHLRRGHVRRQPYGKGRELEKTIWIAPIFVNADPEFVMSRKKYRIT